MPEEMNQPDELQPLGEDQAKQMCEYVEKLQKDRPDYWQVLPAGYELTPVKREAVIQLMGSRHSGRENPIHFDPVFAAKEGLKAPIQTGEMSSACLAEMCVNFYGKISLKMRAYSVST